MKYAIIIILFCFIGQGHSQDSENQPIGYSNVLGGSVFLNNSKNNSRTLLIPEQVITNTIFLTNTTTATNTKYKAFNFSPYYGRRLNKSLMVGVIGGYSSSNFKTLGFIDEGIGPFDQPLRLDEETLTESKTKEISYALFARYYFQSQSKFQFFIEPRVGRNVYKRDATSLTVFENQRLTNESYNERKVLDLSITPGLNYAISNRFNILISAGIVSYQLGTEVSGTQRDNRLIDIIAPPINPIVINQEISRNVHDFVLSMRTSSLYLSFEFRF